MRVFQSKVLKQGGVWETWKILQSENIRHALSRHTPVLTNASEDDETPWNPVREWQSGETSLIITSYTFVHKLDCEYINACECLFLTLCSSADWVCCLRRALRGPASFPTLPPLPIPVHDGEERNLGKWKTVKNTSLLNNPVHNVTIAHAITRIHFFSVAMAAFTFTRIIKTVH